MGFLGFKIVRDTKKLKVADAELQDDSERYAPIVYVSASGTQTVEIADLLLDKKVMAKMKELGEIFDQQVAKSS